MFEVYTGTGDNKQSVGKSEKRNDAIALAWEKYDKTSKHHGVKHKGKVVFNTDFNDPEFLTQA